MTVLPEMTEDKPAGDPALLNRIAWESRWACRSKSRRYAEAALQMSLAKTGKPNRQRGYARVTLAFQAKWRGDFDEGMTQVLDAETHLPEADHPEERAQAYSIIGVIHYSRNRLDLAECAVDRGFRLVTPESGRAAFVDLLTTKATIQRYSGDRTRSGLTIARAHQLAEGADLARVEHNLARWMLSDDTPESAIRHAETSVELADSFRNILIKPYAYEVLGAGHSALGHFQRAEECFTMGLDIAIRDEDTRAQCQIIQRHGDLERAKGDLDRARDLYGYGREVAKKMAYPLWEVIFSRALADVYERLGDLKGALAEHKRAWQIEDARRT
jgi:tetratricopeptide (TPR) repeat protein